MVYAMLLQAQTLLSPSKRTRPTPLGHPTWFTDPNDFPANTFANVRIASLPARGSLTLNNVPVTIGQTFPVANINLNQLRYRPAANGEGTNYASFTFQVQDNARDFEP